jgi:hypothetical protein
MTQMLGGEVWDAAVGECGMQLSREDPEIHGERVLCGILLDPLRYCREVHHEKVVAYPLAK